MPNFSGDPPGAKMELAVGSTVLVVEVLVEVVVLVVVEVVVVVLVLVVVCK